MSRPATRQATARIPGLAVECARDAGFPLQVIGSRRRGRGTVYTVVATAEVAEWYQAEAELWRHHEGAKWRVRPCETASRRIREAIDR